ncbi:putative nucleic acid-binding Zn ribbon protein [Agrococcus sp. UYP33]
MRELAATEPERVWLRLKAKLGDPEMVTRDGRRRSRREPGASVPFGKGRDPRALGDVLVGFADDRGWTATLARADVMAHWGELVGEENADRTEPVSFDEGVLTVRCASTAWTQQMRILRAETTTRILARFPDCGLQRVEFVGPSVPSFSRGRRSVPGRGPRDTWG